MNCFLFVFFQLSYPIEINSDMGFAKNNQKEKILVTNGVFPVEFNLQFKNKLIDINEATQVSKIGDWECNNFKIREFIEKINFQITEAFESAFEPLVMDLKSKDRKERGALAAAGIHMGMAVADKLIGKAVDFLFDSRRRKMEHTVTELQASLHTIKNDLKLSALELCTFGKNLLEEKINRIALELSMSIENQIKREIQKLYFGELDNKYKLSACLALNNDASKYDCLKLIRSKNFVFNILAIDRQNDQASIQLQILTPILSKTILGHRIFNLGIPMTQDKNNFLVKGLMPDFITAQNEYTFDKPPVYQVIEQSLLISSPKIDRDCFLNTTDSDKKCDAIVTPTTANYLIEHINGYTILINFVECSYTKMNSIDEPQFLNVGTHLVTFDLGFLTCAEERISFGHNSIHFRKHVSYSDYKTEFNFVEKDLFLNMYNKNIIDNDHLLSQVPIFPYVSFRIVIIILLIVLLIVLIVLIAYCYKKMQFVYKNNLPPALVY